MFVPELKRNMRISCLAIGRKTHTHTHTCFFGDCTLSTEGRRTQIGEEFSLVFPFELPVCFRDDTVK